jgi:hypothetical protein
MIFFLLLILISSASGIFITCGFYHSSWEVIGQAYTCDVIFMDFSDDPTHITGYNGTHKYGNSSVDVKMITFYCDWPPLNLTAIPKGLLNLFPNLIGINFVYCSIDFLNGDELNEYPNLQWYGHSLSNLTQVPGNLFASTPNIRIAAFIYNQIEHVGLSLLDHLRNLQYASFEHNTCIHKVASNPSEIPMLIDALRENCSKPSIN